MPIKNGKTPTRYHFGALRPGEYIIVPKRNAHNACAAAYMYTHRHPEIVLECRRWGNKGRKRIRRMYRTLRHLS